MFALSDTRPHAAWIEYALRIEAFLYALGQGARGLILGREDVNACPHSGRRTHQCRVPTDGGYCAADCRSVGFIFERHRHPDKPAGPVVEHLRSRRDGARDFVAAAWRHGNAPKWPRTDRLDGKGFDVADAAPQLTRFSIVENGNRSEAFH